MLEQQIIYFLTDFVPTIFFERKVSLIRFRQWHNACRMNIDFHFLIIDHSLFSVIIRALLRYVTQEIVYHAIAVGNDVKIVELLLIYFFISIISGIHGLLPPRIKSLTEQTDNCLRNRKFETDNNINFLFFFLLTSCHK